MYPWQGWGHSIPSVEITLFHILSFTYFLGDSLLGFGGSLRTWTGFSTKVDHKTSIRHHGVQSPPSISESQWANSSSFMLWFYWASCSSFILKLFVSTTLEQVTSFSPPPRHTPLFVMYPWKLDSQQKNVWTAFWIVRNSMALQLVFTCILCIYLSISN